MAGAPRGRGRPLFPPLPAASRNFFPRTDYREAAKFAILLRVGAISSAGGVRRGRGGCWTNWGIDMPIAIKGFTRPELVRYTHRQLRHSSLAPSPAD